MSNFGEIGVSPTFEEFEEIMKKEGIKEGIREGQKEKQYEIALEMLKEGLNLTLIEKLTKLSKEEIKLLQEKLQ